MTRRATDRDIVGYEVAKSSRGDQRVAFIDMGVESEHGGILIQSL